MQHAPDAAAARPPDRVVVLGTTGSGKTTLARKIAATIDARHVELDALFHEPNWVEAERDVFRERVREAIAAERWVTDGGYASLISDLTWVRADLVIWLDYPFPLKFWRLLRRTARRVWTREELWNGNRESLSTQLFSRESLLLFAITNNGKYARTYPAYFQKPEMARARVLRFRRPSQTDRWLAELTAAAARA